MGRKPKQDNCCVDCGKYAIKYRKDYFMATNKLWKQYGVGRGILCLECFKMRAGRELKVNDFTLAPVNSNNPIIQKLKLN